MLAPALPGGLGGSVLWAYILSMNPFKSPMNEDATAAPSPRLVAAFTGPEELASAQQRIC